MNEKITTLVFENINKFDKELNKNKDVIDLCT